ncbi:MAG: hypothetical protein D4R64_05770 [Porphyromonadaceae bacterium]|nr:MAG: hypothetical protein D4R64_05770 [Porphyromonadaceae bacterium]
MKALLTLFILFGFFTFSYGQNNFSNLVTRYCELLGYPTYETRKTTTVQLPNGNVVSAWKFYRGETEQEYSYCSLKGYKIGIRKEKTKDYERSYPVCIKEANGKTIETNLLRVIYDEGDYQKLFPNEPLPIEPPDQLFRPPVVFPPIEPDPNLPSNCYYRDSLFFNSTVHNQDGCGDCYAYAAIAVAEYVLSKALNYPNSIDLSESSIAFCGMNCYPGIIRGCAGTNLKPNSYYALKMTCDNGVLPESAFPEEFLNVPCLSTYWTNSVRYVFNDYQQEQGYWTIQNAIKERGPLYVTLNCKAGEWAAYTSVRYPLDDRTIFVDDRECGGKDFDMDHVVAIVGWGDDYFQRLYWIVKNSKGEDWGDGGYGYIKASSIKISCDAWHLEYKPRVITLTLPQCDYSVVNAPASSDQLSWRMANPSLYSNAFPVIQSSFLPTLINENTQTWDTIFCQVKYPLGCTPAYTEAEISKRIRIGKPSLSEITGPSSVGINMTCLQYVYGPGAESITSYLWTTTGDITIVGNDNNSSCTIKGKSGSLGHGTLTLTANSCYGPCIKTKTIYIDQFSPLAFPNPANTELTVELTYDQADNPDFEYSLIDEYAQVKIIIMTKSKKVTLNIANLPIGIYVLKTKLIRPDQDALEHNQKIMIKR